jgi:Spo0E like sporulation regulatory protein.
LLQKEWEYAMPDLKEVLEKVAELRHQLNSPINAKDNLQDREILRTSKDLDVLLPYFEAKST